MSNRVAPLTRAQQRPCWASQAIDLLQSGAKATLRPRGHSMTGVVNDGDTVIVAPIDPASLSRGDVVLVRVRGHVYLHLVKAVEDGRVLIGNARGYINGWTSAANVYGRMVAREP